MKANNVSITQITYGFLKLWTSTIEVFIRKNTGERYSNILLVSVPIFLFFFLFNRLSLLQQDYAGTWFQNFFIISFILAIIHIVATKLLPSKEMRHSHYNGESLLFSTGQETINKYYKEPLTVLVAGFILWIIGFLYHETYILGIYLMGTAVLMLIKGQIEYVIHREKFLDAQDSVIEAEALEYALKPNDDNSNRRMLNAKDMQGFSIPGKLPTKIQDRKNIANIYKGLNPALQSLMQQSKNKEAEQSRNNGYIPTNTKETEKEI